MATARGLIDELSKLPPETKINLASDPEGILHQGPLNREDRMSMLDSLFGVQRIFINGVELVTRKAVNLVAGVGQLSAADNPTEARSNITIGFPSAAAAPTTGAHVRGEVVLNSAPSAAGFAGWVCTASGTPGTWKTFGAISS